MWILLACVAPDPQRLPTVPSGSGTTTTPRTATSPTTVAPSPAPTWTLEPGWSLVRGRQVEDLTGDGAPDVWLELQADGQWRQVLLAAPVDRPVTLPADAYAWTAGWVSSVVEATGDGQADLLLDGRLLAGPVPPGELARGAVLVEPARIEDVNGDGIGDWVEDPGSGLEIWLGPAAPPSGPPDVVVETGCRTDGAYPLLSTVLPDVTGDGWAELVLYGTAGYDECGGWTMSATPGTTNPQTHEAIWYTGWSEAPLQVVGDQDGDGHRDAWSLFDWVSYELLLGPLVFEDGSLGSQAAVPLTEETVGTWFRAPADANGDGTGDFVGIERDGDRHTLRLGAGGPTGDPGATPLATVVFTGPEARGAFALHDAGHVWVAWWPEQDGAGVVLFDLGPAERRAVTD